MKTIQEQQEAGYKLAQHLDEELNNRLSSIPPQQYPYYWLTITRTLQTTLNIITEEARKGLKENPVEERNKLLIELGKLDIETEEGLNKAKLLMPQIRELNAIVKAHETVAQSNH